VERRAASMSLSLLVVDDEPTVRETLAEFFETFGHTVRAAATGTAARRAAAEHAPDVVVLDLRLPDADGLTLLEALRADDPEIAVIVLTGHADVRTAVGAMQRGAVDLLEKPVDLEALAAAVERAAEGQRLRREVALLRERDRPLAVAEESGTPSVDRLVEIAARNPEAPVLVTGETGTGKGVTARRIHERSAAREAPFVEINCASLTATFFESELFGHERGAFTDARQAKRGLLEVAGRGTVFLDEIGELALEVQPRLLTVLEDRVFRRLGGTTTMRSEARIIAATNRALDALVGAGRFRADLFYRLQVLAIEMPPLRTQAPEAIAALARSLLPAGAAFGDDAMGAVVRYGWPGNIRELKNALWRAAIVADGRPIRAADLALPATAPVSGPSAPRSLADAEAQAIAEALEASGGNRTQAAKLLGIARSTLNEKLKPRN
ncbi:MAG TPA: sigma-54 dependent transcriptional regulator, partial [Gemmatimonadaceae bacterium]|nr:sigma-54 dependent transcriptional regulator [Gemmatimonadaceae bacterium]